MGDREQASLARVGTVLEGGLRLTRLIAVGDLGAVYAADGHATGSVAVKIIHPELRAEPGELWALRAAEEVGHPRAVAPLEITGRAVQTVIAPLISGESARHLVARRRGRIPPSEALRVAGDALEIVGTAHAHDVRHGALSLSHLLIDEAGSVHVIGFGEASLRAALGLGPDRSLVAPNHDFRSPDEAGDLWAVAALLFVLLTDETPVNPREPERVRSLEQVFPRAPRSLTKLLARALSVDRARRFSSAGTLLAAMKQAADDREVMYAHALVSALSSDSGSHALLDPARITQAPMADPSWSSTPPASPHRTPASRPSSRPPPTPRTKHAQSAPAAPHAPTERAPDPIIFATRSPTPPSGEPASRTPTITRATLPPDLDPLQTLGERDELYAARDEVVVRLDSDRARADRTEAALEESDHEAKLAMILAALPEPDDALLRELGAAGTPDPARLVRVAADSLEGPALGPTVNAFGPALKEHLEAAAATAPAEALALLTLLGESVRAPKSLLATERQRVIEAIAAPALIRSLFARLGTRATDSKRLDALIGLLPSLGTSYAAELATALPQITDLTLQAKVLHHLESELSGHEHALGELARGAEPRLGVAVVRLLTRIDTLAAQSAVAAAAESRHPVVRVEALGAGGPSSEALRLELKARLEEGLGIERIHTLRALADHEVRVAAPFIALRIKSPRFDALELEERRSLFHALAILAPARAESLAIEVLDQKKLLSLGSHEETRAIAAVTLGEVGRTEAALESLAHHAERRLGNSDRVRQAAERALALVQTRLTSDGRTE